MSCSCARQGPLWWLLWLLPLLLISFVQAMATAPRQPQGAATTLGQGGADYGTGSQTPRPGEVVVNWRQVLPVLQRRYDVGDVKTLLKHVNGLSRTPTAVMKQGRVTILVNSERSDGDRATQRAHRLMVTAAQGGPHVASRDVLRDPALELAAAQELIAQANEKDSTNLKVGELGGTSHLHGLDNLFLLGFTKLLQIYLSGPASPVSAWSDKKADILYLLSSPGSVAYYWATLTKGDCDDCGADEIDLIKKILLYQIKGGDPNALEASADQWHKLLKRLLTSILEEMRSAEGIPVDLTLSWINELRTDAPSKALNLWLTSFATYEMSVYQNLIADAIINILNEIGPDEELTVILDPIHGSKICQTLHSQYPDDFSQEWEVITVPSFDCSLGFSASCDDPTAGVRIKLEL
ncbi:hypothetical protein Pelo_4280 [Pelomyxa schiedti]|nr:hypothetical protein Pelo_4280 [Pelomyxa schiedti]